jgi:hypothetical protein
MTTNLKRLAAPLLCLAACLYWVYFFAQDKWVHSRDTMDLYYVTKRWMWNHFVSGEMPLWNDSLLLGIYQAGSPATGFFSPITFLFYGLFSDFHAEQFQLPFYSMLAALGTYCLAGHLKVALLPRCFLALIVAFSGAPLSLADRTPFFYGVALYPFCAFFILRFLQCPRQNLGFGALVSCTLAIITINGDWIGAAAGTVLYIVLLIEFSKSPKAVLYVWPLVLAFAIASIGIVPVFENIADSTRSNGFTLDEASKFSFHPIRFLSFFIPRIWGSLGDSTFWGATYTNAPFAAHRFWFHSIYIGSAVSVLGGFGLLSLSRKQRIFFLIALIVFALLAMGSHTPFHIFIFKMIPFYRSLRFPEKFLMFFIFIWLYLAIVGVKALSDKKNWRSFVFVVGLWHFLAAVSYNVLPSIEQLVEHYKLSQTSADLVLRQRSFGLALHITTLITCWFLLRKKIQEKSVPLLLSLTVVELLLFSPKMEFANSKDYFETSLYAKEIDKSAGRFMVDPRIYPSGGWRKMMIANWPILDGYRDVSGYETLYPERLVATDIKDLFSHWEAWSRVFQMKYFITYASPREPSLKKIFDKGLIEPLVVIKSLNVALLGWKGPTPEAEMFSQYIMASSAQDAIGKVIQRGTEKGAVVLEEDPQMPSSEDNMSVGEWTLISKTINRLVFQTNSANINILVHRGSFHTGWRARIDGAPTTVFRADSLSRAVVVPVGKHEVVFEFHPKGFWLAFYMCLLALIFLLFIFSRSLIFYIRK